MALPSNISIPVLEFRSPSVLTDAHIVTPDTHIADSDPDAADLPFSHFAATVVNSGNYTSAGFSEHNATDDLAI